MDRNLIDYYKSITQELAAAKNKVRLLIGSRHWASDGSHKEAVLRNTLKSYIPEMLRVGTGFVCYPRILLYDDDTSRQLDILITDKRKPTLFRDGEVVFVAPDAVRAIVEVKTKVKKGELKKVLTKLVEERKRMSTARNPQCIIGLFVYEAIRASDEFVLNTLHEVTEQNRHNAINIICDGPNRFIRFWEYGRASVGSPIDGPVWHSYKIVDLAYAYFINNLVIETEDHTNNETEELFFPIENTKESYRQWYCPVTGGGPERFKD